MIERLCYIYGVVASNPDIDRAPQGIDGGKVTLVQGAGLAALATSVSAADYAPDRVEALTADVEWVSQRAIAHDRVLTWASDAGAVIPFPMWTLFRTARKVTTMLDKRAVELRETFERIGGGKEFVVRVYAQPGVMTDHLASGSEELAALESQAAKSPPGQRYLLERKIANLRRDAGRELVARVASEIFEALRAESMETVREQPVNSGAPSEQGRAILNGSFLVASSRVVEFRRAVTGMINRHEAAGFKFDFTGPWPPYHFVGERSV